MNYTEQRPEEVRRLLEIILRNPYVDTILNDPPFPASTPWYLAAGTVYQTVWNHLAGRALTEGIEDCDILYFHPNQSEEYEDAEQRRLEKQYAHLPVRIEAINQARVHLWHEAHFGYAIEPYTSCEDAIRRWPSTAVCVGVNRLNGRTNVYAPYGLEDIFAMRSRPVTSTGLQRMYERKT